MSGWLLYLAFPLFSLLVGLPIVLLVQEPGCGVPGVQRVGFPRAPAEVAPASCPGEGRAPGATLTLSEFLFRAVLAGFVLHSAIALVLAEVGLFSLGPFLVVEGTVGVLLAAALAWRRRKLSLPRPSWEDWVPLGLLLLAALLLGQPHPAILGGSDPGTYVGIAANILRTGSLRATDPVWAAMDEQVARTEFLFANMPGMSVPYHRLPGFYALDAASGTVMPQFYHIYPLWLALSFAVARFPAGLMITPVLAGWALVALYYAGRILVGRWPALVASLLLGLNPLFDWLGRHPISEVPAQFLMLASVYALVTFLRSEERDRGSGVLAGAAIGGLLHTRVDSVLALALVGAWLAFRLLTASRRWSTLLPFLLPLGVALAHWALYLGLFTWGYTIDTLGGALRFLLGPIFWPVAFLGAGGFVLSVLLARGGRIAAFLPALRAALALGVLLLALFAWFAWPRLVQPQEVGYYAWNGWQFYPTSQGRNFEHLAWYLSPLGLALGVAGLCVFILHSEVRRAAFPCGILLLYGLLYTYTTAEYPVHPYVMRRQFVVVLPVLVLMAGYALYGLARAQRWTGRLVAATLLLLLGWTFLSASQLSRDVDDFAGIDGQIAGLAGTFAPGDVLLFTDVSTGTLLAFPLQYLYQRSCFVLQRPQPDSLALRDQVQAWQKEGRSVYVLVSPGESRLSPAVFSLEWLRTFSLHWQQIASLDSPPEGAVEQRLLYSVYRLDDAGERPGQRFVDVGGADYPYLVGGFWAPEQTADGTTFRWTNGDATVELPAAWFSSADPLTLTVDLLPGGEPVPGNSSLDVWLDGVLLQRLHLRLDRREYAVPIPADLRVHLAKQDTALLRLRGSSWVPADAGMPDSRTLGVALERIAVWTSAR